MLAINHALTGALMGIVVQHPVVLPLALASHFALDVLPHFGTKKENLASIQFMIQLGCDILLCFMLVVWLFLAGGSLAWLAIVCAFLATSPDFMWIPKFVRALRSEEDVPSSNFLVKFHTWIQWFQRPIGWMVEAAWLTAAAVLLALAITF